MSTSPVTAKILKIIESESENALTNFPIYIQESRYCVNRNATQFYFYHFGAAALVVVVVAVFFSLLVIKYVETLYTTTETLCM